MRFSLDERVETKVSGLNVCAVQVCCTSCVDVYKVNGLRRAELGDSLGSLRDGVLGKFSWKHKSHGSLNLTRRESGLLVVSGKLSGFGGDTLKDIVDEGVHDGHTLLRDTGVRVDLLQDLVNVRGVTLNSLLGLGGAASLLSRGSFLGALASSLGRGLCHVESERGNLWGDQRTNL
jgi:hypothetical protein